MERKGPGNKPEAAMSHVRTIFLGEQNIKQNFSLII